MLSKDDEWMDDSYRRGSIVAEFEKCVETEKLTLQITRAAAVAIVMTRVNRQAAKDPKRQAVKEMIERWLQSSRCPKE